MAFASEFEYEDDLELLEYELEHPESEEWKKTDDLTDFKSNPDGSFAARVSGFHYLEAAPERDEKYDAPRQHVAAVRRIGNEIMKRTPRGKCVRVVVEGYADPYSESKKADEISLRRAKGFIRQIVGYLLYDNRERTLSLDPFQLGAVHLWTRSHHGRLIPRFPNTPLIRVQNRRVHVLVVPQDCPGR